MEIESAKIISKAILDGFNNISMVIFIIGILFFLLKDMGN